MAASTVLMAVLLAAPFINILVWRGGARWLVGLWRGGRGRRGGGGAVGRADRGAVPHHRAEAHAARRADRRRHRRRRLRHRPAGRRDPVLRHAVAISPSCKSDLLVVARARRSRAWCGGRRARCWATSRALAAVLGAGAAAARRRDRAVLRRASASTPSPPPACRDGGVHAAPPAQRLPPRLAARRAAPQGMDAAAARSLARLADADAASLSAAARR